ncbi:MAG: FRG domain-containing protein [bacterium]|nr:FRG domain-containing protein [bacterium]
MKTPKIKSWAELQEVLFNVSWEPGTGRFTNYSCFRGVSDKDYDMSHSLLRLWKNDPRINDMLHNIERSLLRNFKKHSQSLRTNIHSIWEWLSIAQHHRLPTRLLDWTFSPYVAMHFATADMDKFETDGAIWYVDLNETEKLLPTLPRKILETEGAVVFSVEMLSTAAISLEAFDNLSEEPFLVFFEPPSLDNRIVNQYALFSFVSNPLVSIDRWADTHPNVIKKIIIPAKLKREIRNKLDQANIAERVLFPGLDGLSLYLKRLYAPQERRS